MNIKKYVWVIVEKKSKEVYDGCGQLSVYSSKKAAQSALVSRFYTVKKAYLEVFLDS